MARLEERRGVGLLGVRDRMIASSPAYQAYQILHTAFVVAPVIAGLDKFVSVLCNWDKYLAPPFASLLGGPHAFMLVVGVVEVLVGVLVAVKPRIGAVVLAGWLGAIIVNLMMLGNFYDV